MSVKEILAQKGSEVFAINETAKLRDAIKMLNARNIGVVLVTNDAGKLTGILSERDIIRRSLVQETGFRDEPVTKSMTRKVLTIGPGASVDEVMEIMTHSRIRHVPVIEGGKLAGLVSIGDIVKRKIADAEQEVDSLREYIAAG